MPVPWHMDAILNRWIIGCVNYCFLFFVPSVLGRGLHRCGRKGCPRRCSRECQLNFWHSVHGLPFGFYFFSSLLYLFWAIASVPFTASFACIFCLSSPVFLQLDFPPLTTLCPLLFCPSVKAQLDSSSSARHPLVPAAINALPPTHLLLKMELSRVHHVLWLICMHILFHL